MTRELKFRYVWRHRETRRIKTEIYTLGEIESFELGEFGYEFKRVYELLHRDQFTGLKDKNGADIYECDIISSDRTPNTYVIVYDNESAQFMACESRKRTITKCAMSWCRCEVIGDVHRNPELLEK